MQLANTSQKSTDNQKSLKDIEAGDILFSWEVWDVPPVERSGSWYAIATISGLICLIYAMFTANYIFAIIVVMFAVLIMMKDIKKSSRVKTYITTEGIVFAEEFFPFKDIRDFSLAYDPPTIKNLYITFNKSLRPMLSLALEDADPNLIRAALITFIPENLDRQSETLTDTLRRVYKL